MPRTCAVAVDGGLAVALGHAAVDALQGEPDQAQVVLQHIQHDLELAEDQHLHGVAETSLSWVSLATPSERIATCSFTCSEHNFIFSCLGLAIALLIKAVEHAAAWQINDAHSQAGEQGSVQAQQHTLWPSARSFGSSLLRRTILPEACTSCSSSGSCCPAFCCSKVT